jgi:C4-dicarboxylate-specific signal transduction histidine kinase
MRWSAEHFRLFGYDPATTQPSYPVFVEPIHPEDRPSIEQTIATAVAEKGQFQLEYRIVLPDGTVKHLLSIGRPGPTEFGDLEYIGTVMDITGPKRAEAKARDSERRYRELQTELAHASRVSMMGQLTASIAHEVAQPLAAAGTDASAGLRWLKADPPNVDEISQALERVVRDVDRGSAVVTRIRAMVKRAPEMLEDTSLNDAIEDVLTIAHTEVTKHGVQLRRELAPDLPPVKADRVQIQQVLLNLVVNAIDAMSEVTDGNRELVLGTEALRSGEVCVSVRDTGPGIDPAAIDTIFQPFHTTKEQGLGIGLSICRSIVESQGGKLWAGDNAPRGAVFQFTLPAAERSV